MYQIDIPDNRPVYEAGKRAFDILVSCIGMLFLAPAFVLIAFAVKVSSPGPVIYKGLRSGRGGSTFNIFKFRSMVQDADSGAGTTSRNDPRVTPVGRVLRQFKLDELPQLLNVLRGEMSLVGPRPELPKYTRNYRGKERIILSVRPGITDYSSLEFSNLNDLIGDEDPDGNFEKYILSRKNDLRVFYVENRSFLLDLRLIILTVIKVMRRK